MILALDTATRVACVALIGGDGATLAEILDPEVASATRRVLQMIDDVLSSQSAGTNDLTRIVVGRGPGSFTGLRVALATAEALGDALDVPVTGVSTLAALRAKAPPGAAAVIDARRGEVFVEAAGIAPRAMSPSALGALCPVVCVGDGAIRYRAILEGAGAIVAADDDPVHVVSGAALVRASRSGGGPPRPLYLREPDAVPSAAR